MKTEIVQAQRSELAPSAGMVTVRDLLDRAIASGASATPEMMRTLAELWNQERDRQAKAEYVAALSAFQQECPQLLPNRDVFYVNKPGAKPTYSYVTLDKLADAIRPLLAKHGFAFDHDIVDSDPTKIVVQCTIHHMGGHSEKSRFPIPVESKAGLGKQQEVGAAESFARRYSLIAALGIVVDRDTDAAPKDTGEKVNDEQCIKLIEAFDQLPKDRQSRFLAWMGVGDLAEIRASDFRKASDALNKALNQERQAAR